MASHAFPVWPGGSGGRLAAAQMSRATGTPDLWKKSWTSFGGGTTNMQDEASPNKSSSSLCSDATRSMSSVKPPADAVCADPPAAPPARASDCKRLGSACSAAAPPHSSRTALNFLMPTNAWAREKRAPFSDTNALFDSVSAQTATHSSAVACDAQTRRPNSSASFLTPLVRGGRSWRSAFARSGLVASRVTDEKDPQYFTQLSDPSRSSSLHTGTSKPPPVTVSAAILSSVEKDHFPHSFGHDAVSSGGGIGRTPARAWTTTTAARSTSLAARRELRTDKCSAAVSTYSSTRCAARTLALSVRPLPVGARARRGSSAPRTD